jgi:hypothetical protein
MHTYNKLKEIPQNFSLIEAIEVEQQRLKEEEKYNQEKCQDHSMEDDCEDDSTDLSETNSESSDHNS